MGYLLLAALVAIQQRPMSEDVRRMHERLVALSEAELAQLRRQFPAYSDYIIPSGTYNGVSTDVRALGIWSAVVVHESMPEQLAFELTCTLFEHRQALLNVSQVARDMTVANLDKLASVPLHPSTQRYQQEVLSGGDVACFKADD